MRHDVIIMVSLCFFDGVTVMVYMVTVMVCVVTIMACMVTETVYMRAEMASAHICM